MSGIPHYLHPIDLVSCIILLFEVHVHVFSLVVRRIERSNHVPGDHCVQCMHIVQCNDATVASSWCIHMSISGSVHL